MFNQFLTVIFRALKLDKTLYKDNKNFGDAAIYFAGLIMILDGIAGAVFITVFAATAPAIPSSIIIKPAKYIEASPKFLLSL